MSLTGIVQEGNDADLFIGKRYIQLVTCITELVAQKSTKRRKRPGGGVLPNMGYIGMCGPKG